MGCDIHFYVERRVDGVWQSADKRTEDKYEPGAMRVAYGDAFYVDRNYNLFSILADVRNDRGFAGVKTGEGFSPISPPRGVPDDASPEYLAEVGRMEGDGHSHSWLTVAEILAYDWTQTTQLQGWVSPDEWAVHRDSKDGPNGWSGMIGGGSVKHLTSEEFEAAWQTLRAERGYPEQRQPRSHISGWQLKEAEGEADFARMVELLGGGSPVCLVKWSVPYYKAAGNFLGETLPRLLALGSPEDVRCAFFFDN